MTDPLKSGSTHFGFKTVSADEKAGLVKGVFDRVAGKYDIMNDLMSGGMHRLWKETMIDYAALQPAMKVLDLAGGTGDIAFRMLKRAPNVEITLCDINQAMLEEGKLRALDRNITRSIEWVCGNAESLPFPDQHFDICTIAFGIRNVTDIPKALREIYRVLKPGGHFLCLEFSNVQAWLKPVYDAYSFHIVPRVGKAVAGDAEPYQYLVESIRKFPAQEQFAGMLRTGGLANVTYRRMTGGVVALHSGWKIA